MEQKESKNLRWGKGKAVMFRGHLELEVDIKIT